METETETEAEPPSNASSALTLFILVSTVVLKMEIGNAEMVFMRRVCFNMRRWDIVRTWVFGKTGRGGYRNVHTLTYLKI